MGQVLMLLLGCVFLGLGIAFEVIPNVLILPGEGLVRVIAGLTGWRFGRVKTGFDMSIVASAVVVSVAVTGHVLGIREGTVIAALIVGSISHFFIEKVSAALGAGYRHTQRQEMPVHKGRRKISICRVKGRWMFLCGFTQYCIIKYSIV